MTNNVYGIDLGTCNMKIYCKASNKIMNEKNTIALVNKNEMYAYGDDAYGNDSGDIPGCGRCDCGF